MYFGVAALAMCKMLTSREGVQSMVSRGSRSNEGRRRRLVTRLEVLCRRDFERNCLESELFKMETPEGGALGSLE